MASNVTHQDKQEMLADASSQEKEQERNTHDAEHWYI